MYSNNYFTPNKTYVPYDNQGLYKTTKFMPYSFPYMSHIDATTNVDRYESSLFKKSLNGPIYPTSTIKCPFALPSDTLPKTKLVSLPNIPKYTIKDYLIDNHPLFLQKIRLDETLQKQTEFEAVKIILEKQKQENIRLLEIEKECTDNMKKINQNLIEKIKILSDENDELSLERLKLKRECERIKYEYDKEMYMLLHKKKPKLEPEHFEHFVIPDEEEVSVKEEVIEKPKIDISIKKEIKKPEPVVEQKPETSKQLQIELNTDGHKFGKIEQYRQKKLQKKYANLNDKVESIKISKGVDKDKIYLDMYDNKLSVPPVNTNTVINKSIKNSQNVNNDVNNINNANLNRRDSHPKYKGQIQENVSLDKLFESKKRIEDKQAKNAEESKKKKYLNLNNEKISALDKEKVLEKILSVIINTPNKAKHIYLNEYTKTEEHKDELNQMFDNILKDLSNAINYDLNQLCMLVFEIINSNPDFNVNFENVLVNDNYSQNDFSNDIQSDCKTLLNKYIIPHFKSLIQTSEIDIETASNFICKALLNVTVDNINVIINKINPILKLILINS